jgi:hypothetical protein
MPLAGGVEGLSISSRLAPKIFSIAATRLKGLTGMLTGNIPQALQELLRDNSHRETEKGACYRSVSSLRRALTEAKLTEIDAAFVARESALVHVTTKRTFRLLAQLEPQFRRRYSCIL